MSSDSDTTTFRTEVDVAALVVGLWDDYATTPPRDTAATARRAIRGAMDLLTDGGLAPRVVTRMYGHLGRLRLARGNAQLDMGMARPAIVSLREANTYGLAAGDPVGRAWAYSLRGSVAALDGRHDIALELACQGLEVAPPVSPIAVRLHAAGVAYGLAGIGQVREIAGPLDAAWEVMEHLPAAQQADGWHPDRVSRGELEETCAAVYNAAAQPHDAMTHAVAAVAALTDAAPGHQGLARLHAARGALAAGDWGATETYLGQALDLCIARRLPWIGTIAGELVADARRSAPIRVARELAEQVQDWVSPPV